MRLDMVGTSTTASRKRVTEEDLEIVERCAKADGRSVRGNQWITVWQLLKAGVSPYSVVTHMPSVVE